MSIASDLVAELSPFSTRFITPRDRLRLRVSIVRASVAARDQPLSAAALADASNFAQLGGARLGPSLDALPDPRAFVQRDVTRFGTGHAIFVHVDTTPLGAPTSFVFV